MHWLVLYVFCALHFSQLLRLGQKRSCRTMAVVGVNYLLAAAISVSAMLLLGGLGAEGRARLFLYGSSNGVLFVLHALVIMAAFRIVGTGITWAFVGSGVVIPVIVARCIWKEDVNCLQWVALALVPVAVVLMRPPKKEGEAGKRAGLKGDAILLLCLVMAGTIGTLHKAQEVYVGALPVARDTGAFVSPERLFYQSTLFLATAVMSTCYMLGARLRPTGRETAIGLGVGLANTGGLFFALLAINAVAATVFFPSSGCLVIVANTVAGRVLWRERLVPRQWAGLAVALAIVVLANFSPPRHKDTKKPATHNPQISHRRLASLGRNPKARAAPSRQPPTALIQRVLSRARRLRTPLRRSGIADGRTAGALRPTLPPFLCPGPPGGASLHRPPHPGRGERVKGQGDGDGRWHFLADPGRGSTAVWG